MGFFKKLLRLPYKKNGIKPDNTKLFSLIEQYISDNEYESYKKIVFELHHGNTYLLLPSESNLGQEFSSWANSRLALKIKMGIWFKDELKAIAAFTSEKALFEWAKTLIKYVSLRSQIVLEMCEANGIGRIVIDSNQRTMIVLQNDGVHVEFSNRS